MGDVGGSLSAKDVVAVARLLRAKLSSAVKWIVVKSIPFPFDGPCLVVYPSRPIWVQTMTMMIAGYML